MKSDQTKKERWCWWNRVRGLMAFFNIVFNTMLASHDNEDDYMPLFLPHIGAEVTKEQIVDIFRKRDIGEVVHVLLGKGKKEALGSTGAWRSFWSKSIWHLLLERRRLPRSQPILARMGITFIACGLMTTRHCQTSLGLYGFWRNTGSTTRRSTRR